MTLQINPVDHQIKEDCRIMFRDDISDEIVSVIEVKEGEVLEIEDDNILANPENFKFRIQVFKEGKFRNVTKYIYFIDVKKLEDFLLNNIKITDEEAYDLLSQYWKSNLKVKVLRPIFKKVLEHIWINRVNKISNLKQSLLLTQKYKMEISTLWENIFSFYNNLINLYEKLKELNLLEKSFLDIEKSKDIRLAIFMSEEIDRIKESKLQLDNYLIGNYYSFLGERSKALTYYSEAAKNYEDFDLIKLLNFDLGGISTFNNLDLEDVKYDRQKVFDSFKFYSDEIPNDKETTLVFSVDEVFLRVYGPSLLYSITALERVHFHFHVISDNAENIIKDTLNLFNNIIEFRKIKTVTLPTFSYEDIPKNVENITTYYACARFMHADYFLEKFENEILILDADFMFINDLDELLIKCRESDIATTSSSIGLSIFPWRRFMAGIVYLKNEEVSKEFMRGTTAYILNQYENEHTWTLDQNALSFGYYYIKEKFESFNFGDTHVNKRPFLHPDFRGNLEKQVKL
ncbi:hypothetical protein BN1048_00590 [Jeotgalicoccus saudimassiliensis]|uniref:Glycosyl transferase family 8 n=1 Tax=Jeotgalicoccus saudimassiliensis TaxID=1461582 RepID=A0A078M0A3_9STAP|nr:hypothetical protein [Jeotgalicoccus saudimassiliensis]CDZ99664.1 hypothetical protein BN1048_00590 [Jeotgalicoccus saudimassiliensis]